MKTFALLANSIDDLLPTMTTAMLAASAANQNHRCYLCGVDQLMIDDKGSIKTSARLAPKRSSMKEFIGALSKVEEENIDLSTCESLMIRTNPARDPHGDHESALQICRILKGRGVKVYNDPDGLMAARSKLYLLELSEDYRPKTFCSKDEKALLTFVRSQKEKTVLKPVMGTRGKDVFVVEANNPNLQSIINVVTREQSALAQEFLPEAVNGDTRVVILKGKILEKDGHPAAIRRVPAAGDFRSNLHAGGQAERAIITEGMRKAVHALEPLLKRDGLFLVGADFIGDKIIELNVFSTGGLRDAERFSGVDFCKEIIDAL